MGVRSQLRGFVRAVRAGARSRPRHSGDAVASAAGDALHPTGTTGMADRSHVYEQVANGAENYGESFERD